MCMNTCVPTHMHRHLSARERLMLSTLKYGIFCGIRVRMRWGQGGLDRFQELGHHPSQQLQREFIRVAADQNNYSSTEDAWDRENHQHLLYKSEACTGERRAELPTAGMGLCTGCFSQGQLPVPVPGRQAAMIGSCVHHDSWLSLTPPQKPERYIHNSWQTCLSDCLD